MRKRVSIARTFATNARHPPATSPLRRSMNPPPAGCAPSSSSLVKENGGDRRLHRATSIREALEIGDRIVVLKRPAMIAYDVRLRRRHAVRRSARIFGGRIVEVLAV